MLCTTTTDQKVGFLTQGREHEREAPTLEFDQEDRQLCRFQDRVESWDVATCSLTRTWPGSRCGPWTLPFITRGLILVFHSGYNTLHIVDLLSG